MAAIQKGSIVIECNGFLHLHRRGNVPLAANIPTFRLTVED